MDREFMLLALEQAKKALELREVPVGAVIVCHGKVQGLGYNKKQTGKNPLYHAELEAIDSACRALGTRFLHDCTLYVTLEPCPMCAGAVMAAGIGRVVFGAYDDKKGCFGSLCSFSELEGYGKLQITGGYMQSQCEELLSLFFTRLREKE